VSDGVGVLAPYRIGPPWKLSAPTLPLKCSMCYRRLGDIAMVHGRMSLLRVNTRVGIPQDRPKSGRHAAAVTGYNLDGKGTRHHKFKGWVFVNPERDRWRIWCEHKKASRDVLDRTVTAATLERMYAAALAASDREVVL
jgi:hypothetical protein